MIKARSFSEYLLMTFFLAYMCSNMVHLVFPAISMLLLYIFMTLIVAAINLFTSYQVMKVFLFTAIALQLTYILDNTFLLSLKWLSVIGGSIGILFISLSYFIQSKVISSSIIQSLLAASSTSVVFLLLQNSPIYYLIYLTYPVVVACIYVILSKKAEYGLTIVIANTATSIATAYLLLFLTGIPVTNTILLGTWASTLLISFMYNKEEQLVFLLGYQRYLTQKDDIKKDIFLLKRTLLNASEMSDKELLEIVSSLKNFKYERILKNISPGVITRFDLQNRHKQLKASTWLIVFFAYVMYGTVVFYVSEISHSNFIALLIFAPIYYLSVPYVTSLILYKNLVRYVNKQFIIPYNKLMDTRTKLIEEVTSLINTTGHTTGGKSVDQTTNSRPFHFSTFIERTDL